MKALYDKVSFDLGESITRAYSTSFSLGIYFLSPKLRKDIYSIYGFVRLADEIVDSFDGFDKKHLLKRFRADTFEALEMGISANPVLNCFQHTVKRYGIKTGLIETFLDSMEMDLEPVRYTPESYEKYILGSAEVVGLMCLHVFTEGNPRLYDELEQYAMKLGAAFQKVNFLRDLKDDYHILGRSYFPNINMEKLDTVAKKRIEQEIEADFASALEGIRRLPASSKGGVYLAYVYYRALFRKIQRVDPKVILSERVRINNGHKFRLMLNSFVEYKMNLL